MALLKPLLTKGLFGVAGLLAGKKKKEAPAPQIQQTRDTGAEDVFARDRLSRRRGAASNAILGAMGAESSTGKRQLGT
jgi:hypothetical protein